MVRNATSLKRAKHPSRAYEIATTSHSATKPRELMTLDLYGPHHTGRKGVKHVLVCLDIFSKHVALYALKSVTSRDCLYKLKTQYFPEIATPENILHDHGSKFSSPSWRKALSELSIRTRYSLIRHPECCNHVSNLVFKLSVEIAR
jgi:transposase InsO family protein